MGYECALCAVGETSPGGDNPIDGPTSCSCAQDEYCGNGTVTYLSADELSGFDVSHQKVRVSTLGSSVSFWEACFCERGEG